MAQKTANTARHKSGQPLSEYLAVDRVDEGIDGTRDHGELVAVHVHLLGIRNFENSKQQQQWNRLQPTPYVAI